MVSNVPAPVQERFKREVPKFQKVVQNALSRDVNEADTVVIITDMLEQIFGMDKYEDVTREFAIQGTYCDLAVRTGNSIDYLVEVKAIGLDLKDNHLRQAVNYAASEGIRWVVLTNGIKWQIHHVIVDGSVSHELVVEFDFLEIGPRKASDQEMLFLLCKRAVNKDLIEQFYEQKQACNRFVLGALVMSDSVISLLRRQLRQITPGLKVDEDSIREIIEKEVLKREVVETDSAKDAQKKLKRAMTKIAREKAKKKEAKEAAES